MDNSNRLKILIIGPGIVGQATGKALIKKGFDVTFLGVDPKNVEQLKKEGYKAYLKNGLCNGSYQFDVSFLTVPTPTENGKINLQIISDTAISLGKRLAHHNNYHLVVVKSTVLPGTTEHLIIPLIEKYSGKKVGQDFGVCMNPEYLRENTSFSDMINSWLVVIGEYDRKSGDILYQLYEDFDCPIYRVKLAEAEMQKYIHNLYNAAKISFFNEMRQIGQHFGMDMEKIFKLITISAEGMWNPKYGTKDKGPYSGKCLPKDTQAFLHWAKGQNLDADLLEAVIRVNDKLVKKLSLQKEHTTASHSQIEL